MSKLTQAIVLIIAITCITALAHVAHANWVPIGALDPGHYIVCTVLEDMPFCEQTVVVGVEEEALGICAVFNT